MAARIDEATRTIRIERMFDAPRERVFDAWTQPELLMQWYAPRGCTIKLAKLPGSEENYALQMNVAANLPKERTAGKDEKKEDKEKLDKEFTDSHKKLEEKLKSEKQF